MWPAFMVAGAHLGAPYVTLEDVQRGDGVYSPFFHDLAHIQESYVCRPFLDTSP